MKTKAGKTIIFHRTMEAAHLRLTTEERDLTFEEVDTVLLELNDLKADEPSAETEEAT